MCLPPRFDRHEQHVRVLQAPVRPARPRNAWRQREQRGVLGAGREAALTRRRPIEQEAGQHAAPAARNECSGAARAHEQHCRVRDEQRGHHHVRHAAEAHEGPRDERQRRRRDQRERAVLAHEASRERQLGQLAVEDRRHDPVQAARAQLDREDAPQESVDPQTQEEHSRDERRDRARDRREPRQAGERG